MKIYKNQDAIERKLGFLNFNKLQSPALLFSPVHVNKFDSKYIKFVQRKKFALEFTLNLP